MARPEGKVALSLSRCRCRCPPGSSLPSLEHTPSFRHDLMSPRISRDAFPEVSFPLCRVGQRSLAELPFLFSPLNSAQSPLAVAGREAEGWILSQTGSGSLSHFHGNAKGRGNPLIRILRCGSTPLGKSTEIPLPTWKPQTGSSRGPSACPAKTNLKSSQEFGCTSGKLLRAQLGAWSQPAPKFVLIHLSH